MSIENLIQKSQEQAGIDAMRYRELRRLRAKLRAGEAVKLVYAESDDEFDALIDAFIKEHR